MLIQPIVWLSHKERCGTQYIIYNFLSTALTSCHLHSCVTLYASCIMTFFPLPGTYLVVEIDVEKTLQCLDDPSANAAAAGIRTTKCIVYLDIVGSSCGWSLS